MVTRVISDPVEPSTLITYTVPLTRTWLLPAGAGERAVYVKYRTPFQSESVSRDTIWLAAPTVTDTTTMPALPPAMQHFQTPDNVGAVTFDYGLKTAGGLLPPALTIHQSSFVADESRNRQGSALGVGATLGEYAILRRPDTTPASTSDDSYLLLWDGVLMPLTYADPATGGDGLYHREREQAGDAFTIRRHSGASHAIDSGQYWVITDTQGLVRRLGFTSDSAWRYVDPTDTAHVWRWNLDRVQDSHSNYQTWSYSTEPGTLNSVAFERGGYLDEIAWNGNVALSRAPDRRLSFSYISRATGGSADYDVGSERFYVTKRLDRIEMEIDAEMVWDYQLSYELPVDAGRTQVLLAGITQRGADGTTVLADMGLDYTAPVVAGEGYHLGGVAFNGTTRESYTYARFLLNGVYRYRIGEVEWPGGAPELAALRGSARMFAADEEDCRKTTFSIETPFTTPDGSWVFTGTTIDNCKGDEFHRRYRPEPDFRGQQYKQFCKIAPTFAMLRQSDDALDRALAIQSLSLAGGAICHEQALNLNALSTGSGATRIQPSAMFEDVLQPDGSTQKLQTSYTYNSGGQPIYLDQYGEQDTPSDDRFIERQYHYPSYPDLATREDTRDTQGRLVARTTYTYAPGTRLLAAEARWLLEESRPLTTTYSYDARGLPIGVTDPMGHTTGYGYDSAGNRTVVTDTLGFTTHFTFDDAGRILSQTDARGAVTTYAYDLETGTLTSQTDALGNLTSYTYDARKRKIAEENALGAITRYGYNDLDQLVAITDTLGLVTQYEYDSSGNQVATIDPLGRRTEQTYETAHGWLTTATNALGVATSFQYDGSGRQTSVTDARGATSQTEYDGFGRVVATIDPLGHRQTVVYDALDRSIRQTNALTQTTFTQYDSLGRSVIVTDTLGYATRYQYDDADRQIAVTDPRSFTTEYEYDAAGRLVAETNPLNQTTFFGYDAVGNQTVITDTLGYTTHSTYDLLGRLVASIDALGHSTGYGYDAVGNQTVITDTLGYVTRSTYDLASRRIAVTDALSQTTLFGYDAVGNQTLITDTAGVVTQQTYDAANRLIASTRPLTQTERYGYNAVGQQTIITDTAGVTSTLAYDLAGQPLAVSDGLGQTTTQEYDALGRLVRSTRPDGVVTFFEYDAGNRLIAVTENERLDLPADNATDVRTTFSYDANGNLLTITDANGHTQSNTYDALNRPITQSDPLLRMQQLFYTARGELDYTIDALNRTTNYSYDAAGRLTAIDYPSGTADVGYQYDWASNVLTMTDGLGTTIYSYDALHRMQTRSRDGRTVTYTYRPDSQVTQIDYWNRGSVVAGYDAAGRLDSFNPWGAGATSYTYRTQALLATISRPNDVTTSYSYDAANRLRGMLHARGGGSPATLQQIQYTLDANGNPTLMTDLDGSTTLTTTYQYDPLQRLTQVAYPTIPGGPGASTLDYTLDAVGNRLSDGTTALGYDDADQVASFSYDANGNLLDDGATSYSYDAANRLVQSITNYLTPTSSLTTTYGYDGWGNLLRETVQSSAAITTTDFVLDERGALTRILGAVRSDATEELYAYGPEGVAAQRTIVGGTLQDVLYPLLDGLGSLRHLTDEHGDLVLSRHYDAWGTVRHSSGSASTRLGYTGELVDGATGLVYLRARHYSPALGRFLQRDSFAGIPTTPQSLHRYIYAHANPLRYTDPSGHAVDENGHWTPCNLLPGRADSCSLQDFRDWWGSDDGDKTRTFAITVVTDLGMALASIPNIPYQLMTDPKGVIWGILYGPFQFGSDLLHGMVCGDPERLAHATTTYGLFVAGGIKGSLDDLPSKWPTPDTDHPPSTKRPPRLPCVSSFSANTLVSTADGLRPISTIRVGDLVLAYDEASRTTGLFTVTAVLRHLDPAQVHLTIGGEHVETTPEHPFFTQERGWVDAANLWRGAHVRQADGSYDTVWSVAVETEPQVMYNLTVAQASTFFVGTGRWLVHNVTCGPPLKLSNRFTFRRGPRTIVLEQGDSKWGWTHIWERHIDLNSKLFPDKTKFPGSWTEANIVDILGKTFTHGKKGDYYNMITYEYRTNYLGAGYKTYRLTIYPDGKVQTFHPLD